jgi:hypothetical protein
MHLKLLEKQEQTKPKTSRQREITKSKAEINETKQIIQRINETKNWFSEKINKIDKLLANMIKQKREKTQINKIRDEKGDIPQSRKIIREYFENLYSSKLENLHEMDKFLDDSINQN